MARPDEPARSAAGAFLVGEVLHRGPRSVVVAATRVADGRPVVLKSVAPGSADPTARQRLRHEHQVLRRLDLPEVVRCGGLVVSPLGLALVLERPDGRPLRDRLGRPHSLDEVLEVGVALARAVGRLHRAGLAHLALSPDSVRWDEATRRVVLCDLGSASRITRPAEDTAGMPVDEVAYLSPEQTGRMNRPVDGRSDLWAIGVLLHALLSGRPPFVADDVLTLVHAIVARDPEPLGVDAPDVVRALLARLLAKSPEDRYQSAGGLLHDLLAVQAAWREHGRLDGLRLGTHDRSERLRLPSGLYGRAREVEALRAAAARCLAGELAGVTVVGAAGVGKSALAQELRPWATERGGWFGAGKFDQLRRTQPYAPLVAAVDPVLRQLLAGTAPQVERWRERLGAVLGAGADVLRDVLPTLGELLPGRGALRELPPVEARGRVLAALLALLRALHAPDAPLVLLLDDLQWADPGTFDLVEALLRAPDARNPVLVLAWRDHEVDGGHLLAERLARMAGDVVERVTLGNLAVGDVARLLVDALGADPDEVRPLAAAVVAKTSGNPFFVRTFVTALAERGTLAYDAAVERWAWSLPAVERDVVTDNVVDLLSARLATQPAASRALAAEVASFGQRVDLDLLSTALGRPADAVREAAVPLVEAGLLVPEGAGWAYLEGVDDATDPGDLAASELRFPHDRVQQAAYALRPPAERVAAHLAAVRRLVAAGFDRRDDRLFAVADPIVRAVDAVVDPAERRSLARVVERAGQRARAAAAFGPALQYLEAAATLLGERPTGDDAALAFRVHRAAAEASVVASQAEGVEAHLARAAAVAPTELDRLELEQVRIRAHLARGEQREAVERTLAALAALGERFPAHPGPAHAGWALLRTTLAVRRTPKERLRSLPVCEDRRVELVARLMTEVSVAAYLYSTNLSLLFLLRTVDLSLRWGVVPESSYGWAGYAMIVGVAMHDLERARRYADIAGALVDRFDAVHLRAKVDVLRFGFVRPRYERLVDLVDPWDDVQRAALEGGDVSTAGLATTNVANFGFSAGLELEELERRLTTHLAFTRRLGEERSTYWHELYLQLIDALRGRTADPLVLDGDRVDQDAWLAHCRASGDTGSVTIYELLSMQLRVLLGAADTASAHAEAAVAGLGSVLGTHSGVYVQAYAALVDVAVGRRASVQGQRSEARARLRAARRKLRWLGPWVRHQPSYAGLAELLRAELADAAGRHLEAEVAYDEAVRLSKAVDHVHEAALALELAGRSYLRRGLGRVAGAYLVDARARFVQWGGIARLDRFDTLLRDAAGLGGPTRLLSPLAPVSLDAAAVTVAARALSGEIRLAALLERLLRLAVEAGGATSGALVLVRGGVERVVATARVGAGGVEVEVGDVSRLDEARGAAEALGASASVVAYVLRTRERLVIDDVAADPRFPGAGPGSVLAAPLERLDHVVGAVLLEHRLARGAFTTDRLEVVGVLAAQAAVSLENALLYESLAHALDDQRRLTAAYQRFVPPQFLRQLGKHGILDVRLGDQVEREITVLFADVRSFSALAERLGPAGTFAFINRYLAHMEPAIHAHGGYVHQYLGDGILALFPGSADDAVQGALAMLAALDRFNDERRAQGEPPVRIGLGLNTGPLVVGAIGGLDRLDRGVVGDAINVAGRVEGLCKGYGATLLVTGDTHARLADPGRYQLRLLDRVVVSGKSSAVDVHEVLDGEPASVRAGKLAGRGAYERGLEAWRRADFGAARDAFEAALAASPTDEAAAWFVERCLDREAGAAVEPWDGLARLTWK